MSRSACAIGKDVVPASFKGVPKESFHLVKILHMRISVVR